LALGYGIVLICWPPEGEAHRVQLPPEASHTLVQPHTQARQSPQSGAQTSSRVAEITTNPSEPGTSPAVVRSSLKIARPMATTCASGPAPL
jgi:hypothetical protein